MELSENLITDTTYADVYEQPAEVEIHKNMASRNHAKIQSRLAKVLGNSYDENYDVFTEFEMELIGKKVIPDVSMLPLQPSNWQKDEIRGTEPPILAIEILSPRQSYDEIVTKIREIYLPAGVRSVWFIIPSTGIIQIFTPDSKIRTIAEGGILKDTASGFEVDLSKIFR